MASGVFTGTTNNRYITAKIEWTAIPDNLNNRSTVTAIFYVKKSSSSSEGTTGEGNWTLRIGTVDKSIHKTMNVPNNDVWQEIGSNTVVVDHNPDGSKTIQIVGTGGTLRTSWTTTNVSGSAVLDPIPRETTPTFDSATKDFGSTLAITLTPAESTFKHTVSVQWQGTTTQIKTGYTSGTFNYSIPLNWMNDIPNSVAGSMYVIVETYNADNSLVGTTVSTVALNVPSSVVPTISTIAITDTGGIIPASWGILVKGQSILHVKATASGAYGSTILAYKIEALDVIRSTNDVDIGLISESGSVSVRVTVTDSRGRTATLTQSKSVTDYDAPVISALYIQRTNNQGVPVDNGTYLKVTLSCAVSSLASHNAMTIKIYHKRSDAETRTLARTVTPTDISLTEVVYMISGMETSRSYDVDVEITDVLTTIPTVQSGILPAEGGVISWMDGGQGVAFGKAAEDANDADFRWRLHCRSGMVSDVPVGISSGGTGGDDAESARENLGAAAADHGHDFSDGKITGTIPANQLPMDAIVNALYPVGSIFITTNSADPSMVFAGTTWEQIKDVFLLSAGDSYTAGSTGGAASSSHKHGSPVAYNSSAVGFVNVNGTYSSGNGKAYRTANTDYSGTLSTNVTVGYTTNTSVDTMPPYLAVYVWKRTA